MDLFIFILRLYCIHFQSGIEWANKKKKENFYVNKTKTSPSRNPIARTLVDFNTEIA